MTVSVSLLDFLKSQVYHPYSIIVMNYFFIVSVFLVNYLPIFFILISLIQFYLSKCNFFNFPKYFLKISNNFDTITDIIFGLDKHNYMIL
jgi:hypothetical protein